MCLAIPGKIIETLGTGEELGLGTPLLATVDVMGVRRKVDLALLADDNPKAGDWVLIHVGFAMSKISEEHALETLRILETLGEADAARQEAEGYGDDAPGNRGLDPDDTAFGHSDLEAADEASDTAFRDGSAAKNGDARASGGSPS